MQVKAQQAMLTGIVADDEGAALIGATVYWLSFPDKGTLTNQEGAFELFLPEDAAQRTLIASYVGYQPDTIVVRFAGNLFIQLMPGQTLQEVNVNAERSGTFLADAPGKVEVISAKELTRAACCDLAGCFETTASVHPMTTNVVTQSKELRTLGLAGVYNQVLVHGMPLIQGLSYTYGINGIPGPLIRNIYVAKGANSVLQGFESISGQINVELKEAAKSERIYLNVYGNSFGETQYNALIGARPGKWAVLTAAHVTLPASRIDRDKDTFLDVPLVNRYSLYQQWQYQDETVQGWSSRIGLRYLHEKRIGGQSAFDASKHLGGNEIYGQSASINQPEVYTKTGYRFNANQKVTLLASAFYHNQNSYFGTAHYTARQWNGYANLQYEHNWQEGRYDFKAGLSMRRLQLDEDIDFGAYPLGRTYAGNYLRSEFIPGVFAEQVMRLEPFTIIAGARFDHHNQFGWFATPRALLRYDFSERTNVRVSAGTGFRTVNLFSENIGLLASSRNIIFAESIRPERALNTGVNLNHTIAINHFSALLSADFFHTRFSNQFFPDYDTAPTVAIIANFDGPSVSNSAQFETKLNWDNRFEAKIAYNYLEVYRKHGETKHELPFNSRHKILLTLSYETSNERWRIDANTHWFGRQRLPDTRNYPDAYQQPDFSTSYATASIQATHHWKNLEMYAGVENMFDFRQLRPILSWQDPFGPYFDTAFNWGPTRGREWYAGLRFKLD